MRSRLVYPLLAVLIGILVSLSFSFKLFTGLEYFFEDLLFQSKPVDERIVIVAIDDESIQQIGQWPWPRAVYGDFINKLKSTPPAALGLDIVFSEKSRAGESDDRELANALEQANFPVILAVEAISFQIEKGKTYAEKTLSPISQFQNKNTTLGLVNVISDSDNIVRRFPLISYRDSEDDYKTFAYEILERSNIVIPEESNLLPINRIVYAGEPESIRRISFWRVLEDKLIQEQLQNKIILLGATAEDLHDTKSTPLSRGSEMPGVEIHGNILNMLLKGEGLLPLNLWQMIAVIFFICLLTALTFIFIERLAYLVILNSFFALVYLSVVILAFEKGVVINLIHGLLAVFLTLAALSAYRFRHIDQSRRQLKLVFSKYVSPSVLDQIMKNPEDITLGGSEKEITVLFSDIRGFTSISEKMAPAKLVLILNRYFSAMTGAIIKNDGVLDKYIGDAVMAFWGAPLKDGDQADKAVKAALDMLEGLNTLNQQLLSEGEPEIKIGIGIYTGLAVAGNIGSLQRFNYTVIGDTVNIASRLEGLTKEYKTEIIIGESTKNKLTENFNTKELGVTKVKGKEEGIRIYGVIKNS